MNSTIKPFDNLNVRKAVVAASDRNGAAAHARRHGGRRPGDALPAADVPRLRGRRRRQGPGAGLPGQPARRHGAGQEVHARGQEAGPEPADRRRRHVDRLRPAADGRHATPTRARRPAEVAQAQFEKLGFKIKFRTVPQDTLYTKFCNVPGAEDRDLPERRLLQGLQRPAVAARPRVQRQEHPAAEQLQLAAAQRPRHQRRDGEGGGAARPAPSATRRGARSTTWSPQQAPAIPYLWDKIPTVEARRRPRRGQPVLHELGPRLHLAEVAPGARSACTADRAPSRTPPPRGGARSGHGRMAAHGPPSCSPSRPRAAGAWPTSSAAFRASACRCAVVLCVVEGAGLVVVLAIIAATGEPFPGARAAILSVVAGIGGVIALGCFYRALAIGTMSIVAPISATGVALPVVVGVATGDSAVDRRRRRAGGDLRRRPARLARAARRRRARRGRQAQRRAGAGGRGRLRLLLRDVRRGRRRLGAVAAGALARASRCPALALFAWARGMRPPRRPHGGDAGRRGHARLQRHRPLRAWPTPRARSASSRSSARCTR